MINTSELCIGHGILQSIMELDKHISDTTAHMSEQQIRELEAAVDTLFSQLAYLTMLRKEDPANKLIMATLRVKADTINNLAGHVLFPRLITAIAKRWELTVRSAISLLNPVETVLK